MVEPAVLPAVAAFEARGVVIVPNVLTREFAAELHERFLEALHDKMSRFNVTPQERVSNAPNERDEPNVAVNFVPKGGNHDQNRWNMHLPSRRPFLDPRVFANPKTLPILRSLIGDDMAAYMLASDANTPGSGYQNAHRDFGRFGITMNVALCDVTEDMGPIEVWPGTHVRRPGVDQFSREWISDTSKESLRDAVRAVEPEKGILEAGSALIRDHRLVHRGTPNRSNKIRSMLSIYYLQPHPVPYRPAYHAASWFAANLRSLGRGAGGGTAMRSTGLVSRGNRVGRILDELALTDRDYRRPIPSAIWDGLPPDARRLLRYGLVEGLPASEPGSLAATAQMTLLGLANAVGIPLLPM